MLTIFSLKAETSCFSARRFNQIPCTNFRWVKLVSRGKGRIHEMKAPRFFGLFSVKPTVLTQMFK